MQKKFRHQDKDEKTRLRLINFGSAISECCCFKMTEEGEQHTKRGWVGGGGVRAVTLFKNISMKCCNLIIHPVYDGKIRQEYNGYVILVERGFLRIGLQHKFKG